MVKSVAAFLILSMTIGTVAFSSESTPNDTPIDLRDAVQAPCKKGQLSSDRGCVTEPQIRKEVRPRFPKSARHESEGRVVLNYIIQIDGTVGRIEVVDSMRPGDDFEKAVIDALKQWRYTPATIAGTRVPVMFRLKIDFSKQ
jgi:TonB family protein